MKIDKMRCDICNYEQSFSNPLNHIHPELELNGVPVNIWSPIYNLKTNEKGLNILPGKGILKFKEYLPDYPNLFSLGEGNTPLKLIEEDSFGNRIYLKDESFNPTGSFKDRGMPFLISEAIMSGKKVIGIPSTGNAGVSMVRYAQASGIDTLVFVPESTSPSKLKNLGKNIIENKNLTESYEHFFTYLKKDHDIFNGFPVTNMGFYQGIKTISYEIYLQLNNRVPDWIITPCGSGVNIVSQNYGFNDLNKMGISKKVPKFVSVQIKDADPITHGFNSNIEDKLFVLENPKDSQAEAIASDTCFNFFKIMRILKSSKGMAVSVTDKEIENTYESDKYPPLEFSSRSVYVALDKIRPFLNKQETVVLTGTARDKGD